MISGLYVISDDNLTPKDRLFELIEESLIGGAKIVQLRDKISSDEDVKIISRKLELLCKKYDALFVLNDRVELAIELNISGLHIGKSDYHRVNEIREKFKGIIGVSCYGDVDFARSMQDIGIDYVAFGSFFTSPTKPNSSIVSLEVVKKAKEILDIPVCVIGGINSDNIDKVLSYKPDMVSLISDIWNSENIEQKSRFYAEKIKEIL